MVTSSQRAALEIRRMIFDGRIAAGERVPQGEVAEALGISLLPLREALIALEREGWVSIRPNRGAFVNALDEDDVADHYAVYGIAYGFAVERALARSSATELAAALEPIRAEAAATADADRFHQLTVAFHATVVSAARSSRVKILLRATPGLVPGNFFRLVPGAVDAERRGSAAVAAAVAAGRAGDARRSYVAMMREQGELAVAAFGARGLFRPASAGETAGGRAPAGGRRAGATPAGTGAADITESVSYILPAAGRGRS